MAEIHVKGLAALAKFLEAMPQKLAKNVLRGSLRAGMKPVQVAARQNVHAVSGQLAKGLKISTRSKGDVVYSSLRATGKHGFVANFLEFGTKAHVIAAKKKKALTFNGEFYRRVNNNPGIGKGAKAFMRKSLDAQAGAALVAVGEYMKKRLAEKNGLDTADIEIGIEP